MKKTLSISFLVMASPLLFQTIGCGSESTPPRDTASPTVLSTAPTAGATGISTTPTITVTFSEPMDATTIDVTTFTLRDAAGAPVTGAVSSSGATATFTPSAPLSYLLGYTATVTTGARDVAGNALGGQHAWSFTVVTTPSPLLAPETLATWNDGGLVNGTGDNRVIVLDVNSAATYAAGHVPGAHLLLSGDIYQNRKEGPAVDVNMVPDGTRMDSLVQAFGIDGRTTVVFTGSSLLGATRAYWTFRYWGFPKEMLKLLDGLNAGWGVAYGLTTVASPTITPSTHSVRANGVLRADLRASLSEMFAVASGSVAGAIILDARGASGSYAGTPGSTAGVFTPGSDFVVFEGHMNGAQALDYTAMYDAGTLRFQSAETLAAQFASVGIDSARTTYAHCRTGVIASVPFFVLDAILGWPVLNYDASWSQWGQLSADSANGGQLAADSPWRADLPGLSSVVVYNHASRAVELLSLDGPACSGSLGTAGELTYNPVGCALAAPDSYASGNEIEVEDAAYMAQ